MAAHANPIALIAPHYAAGGTALHRYLDADFVPRFRQGLAAGALADPANAAWQREDRFSRHDDALVLRLPVHRTFYLIACEVVCERAGRPALDPTRIVSAGFVLRRVGRDGERLWRLDDGEPAGWQPVAADTAEDAQGRDPDIRRRLLQRRARLAALRTPGSKAARRRAPVAEPAAYTGEETHPLQPLAVTGPDGRPRTLLFGYLPLGGQYRPGGAALSADDSEALIAADRALLPYPLNQTGSLARHWGQSHARLVQQGRPNALFADVLGLLVQRYHVGEAAGTAAGDDDDLAAWAAEQRFDAGYSLLDYLSAHAAAGADGGTSALVAWLADRERLGAAHNAKLPARPVDGGSLTASLAITRADAEELRTALGAGVTATAGRLGADIPVPKFQQGPNDLFQVLPFLRTRDDAGCECVTWGERVRSRPFRVAAPFDADASRPALIQMPSLFDLRRGMAKGAAMLIPPDTQDLLSALKLNKGVTDEVVGTPGPGLGIQWICSFSLPVITLVAMILLMIMIALLNILFFWLPWVRICLPFPKRN